LELEIHFYLINILTMKKLGIIAVVLLVIVGGAYFLMKKYSVNPPVKALSKIDTEHGLPLDRLKLPEGFKIEVYAKDVTKAREMCLSSEGTLYVGTRDNGNVYALRDEDKDGVAEKKYIIYSGGNDPNGVALKDGNLYVAEVNRVLRFDNIEKNLATPPQPVVVYDKYPTEKHHGQKFIAFGPDGKLYIPVGAPCNICESKDPIFNSITRINPDGSGFEIVSKGVRNTVGFTWHPDTKEMWFTDNGRDMLGDDKPNCELNRSTGPGQHFGYPYVHQGDILDPEFGKNKKLTDYVKPVALLGPHTAPLGIEYYRNGQFPATHNNKFFIAKHGSWNRTEKIGYDVDMVEIDSLGGLVNKSTFISGWLSDDKKDVWGRPVDLETMPDGSLLVSDDFANCIYKVSYKK
jgi:glucose/arabinose dehydrogenase